MNDTGNKNRAVESECGPFHLSQLRGAQSIVFTKAPYLLSAASVAGSKEAQGPLGKCFDLTNEDDLFGAETWEEAESNMQKEACVLALGKSHVDPKSVRYLFGGDLLRQGIATSMGVEDLQIPIFGLYGACSTSGERVFAQGYSYVSNYKMKLYHIIPQTRLEEQYVIRLIDGLVKGRVDFIKSQKFGKVKCLLRKIKYFMEIQIQKNALDAKNLSVEELWKHKVALYQAEAFVKSL